MASVGLLAGLVRLAALAAAAPPVVSGLVGGLALATVLHTALGTYDLVWRDGAGPWLLLVPVVVAQLAAQAATIAGQRPDVVALSEVDRAWLLNGGHDTLLLLARRLGMHYHFAPAADPVWGDAVLTRLPTSEVRTVALPAVGAPTGAQALAVVVRLGTEELVVVSTHPQPPPGAGPVVQARRVARFATGLADGRPLVVAGDLNTEPGDPAFEVLRAAGLTDALVSARPLATSPADAPRNEIDHVLVSPGVTGRDAVAVPGQASDHLAVAVTLILPG